MAITKIHAIKSTLGKALAYIENPDKTDGQMLVSGYNCEPQTASIDFEMTAVLAHKARNLKRKRSTNLAYHLIQSFSPEDAVTPEQAHELGKKLAFEYTGGKYEYVVATHIDKGHIHNHIMINAVSFYDYKGYLTYNKSHIDDFLSHKSIKNSEQDYILVKGSFEPIISEELWDKCQRRRHAWQSYKDGNITQAYLYGKSEHADKWACRLFCGCGARMRAFRAEKGIVRYICYQRSLRNVAPKCSAPNVQAWKLELMAREIYKNVWQDHRQDILEEYQQEQENGAADSEKVEEALSWQESFPNDEISREFLDRFVPRIFSIDGQKFIWELNLFQESCTVQCNVRGTYNYHSISAEKIMPGKTKAKKGDGAVNRILEDANSTRFWVHTYDDDPISRLLSRAPASNLAYPA